MTLDEVITIPRLREMLGGVGDSEDDRISTLRAAAVRVVEDWTGRAIIDIRATTEPKDYLGRNSLTDCYAFEVRDAKPAGSVALAYVPKGSDTRHALTGALTLSASDSSSVRVSGKRVLLFGISDRLTGNGIDATFAAPTLTLDTGMAAGDLPASFPEAVGLLVRMFYEGSGFDALPKKSTLSLILGAHRKPVE